MNVRLIVPETIVRVGNVEKPIPRKVRPPTCLVTLIIGLHEQIEESPVLIQILDCWKFEKAGSLRRDQPRDLVNLGQAVPVVEHDLIAGGRRAVPKE